MPTSRWSRTRRSWQLMDVPEIGTLTRASAIGFNATCMARWSACEDCGAERWVLVRKGEYALRCRRCSGSRAGRTPQAAGTALCDLCRLPFDQKVLSKRFCSTLCHDSWWSVVVSARRARVRAERQASLPPLNERRARYERERRARKVVAGGSYTLEEWSDLCATYGFMCLACERNDVQLTVDHVVPLSKGGANGVENLQPLCGSCNSSKRDRVIDYRPQEVRYA